MDLSTAANLIATAAIVASLGLVAFEIRQTRKQSELTNWRELLTTMTAHKAQTNDLALADLIIRGGLDYQSLNAAEKLAFGNYLEQGVHIYGNFLKHNDSLPNKLHGLDIAITNHFWELLETPGGATWWSENHTRRRFMPDTYVITDRLLERRRANNGEPV